MLSASNKKQIFQLVDPVQHQDVFSKGLQGEFCQLQPFQVEIYLIFPPKSPTEIVMVFEVRRVLSSGIHSTQLSNCIESISGSASV